MLRLVHGVFASLLVGDAVTKEELKSIKEMAEGDLWICDNGLCDCVLPLVTALEETFSGVDFLETQVTALRAENTILRERLMTANADLHAARYELAKTRKP